MPTFVSAHTFCASRKAMIGGDIDAINYAAKYTIKTRAKFSYCKQITF